MILELRITACAAMLAIAAIIDIKKREIPDKVWIGFIAFGALLAIIQLGSVSPRIGSIPNDNSAGLFAYLLGIGVIAPISYAVYKLNLFGGADSKALIAIAVLIPSYDFQTLPVFKLHGFTALTVLTNALIISMSQLVFNSVRNLVAIARGVPIFEGLEEGIARKALAFAMGYRSTTSSSQGYLFPMEGVDESGKRKFVFNPARYGEFVGEGCNGGEEEQQTQFSVQEKPMWVTQALPFIVYIALGFGVAISFGDIFGAVIQTVFH